MNNDLKTEEMCENWLIHGSLTVEYQEKYLQVL